MAVDTLENDAPTVEEDALLGSLDPPQAEARDHGIDGLPIVEQIDPHRVEMRCLRRPRLCLRDSHVRDVRAVGGNQPSCDVLHALGVVKAQPHGHVITDLEGTPSLPGMNRVELNPDGDVPQVELGHDTGRFDVPGNVVGKLVQEDIPVQSSPVSHVTARHPVNIHASLDIRGAHHQVRWHDVRVPEPFGHNHQPSDLPLDHRQLKPEGAVATRTMVNEQLAVHEHTASECAAVEVQQRHTVHLNLNLLAVDARTLHWDLPGSRVVHHSRHLERLSAAKEGLRFLNPSCAWDEAELPLPFERSDDSAGIVWPSPRAGVAPEPQLHR
mmetsp:Transcript_7486/g.17757  ORF Transcript_7486/g.17757 Transcript_7486/m.17757 type:complete len:326 (-) Transcript_7486:147-1124(-)